MRCQSRRKVSEKEYFQGEKKFERERERKIMKFSSWIVLQRGVTFLASTIKKEEILFLFHFFLLLSNVHSLYLKQDV